MKALKGKILFKIDTRQKEKYDLGNGTVIHWERNMNFNLREDKASRGECIDAEFIPPGASILVHHNSTTENQEVPYLELFLTADEIKEGYRVFNIDTDMCFCYFENGEWQPCRGFLITMRIFKPYKGLMIGVSHEQVKNRMYVVRGKVYGEDTLPIIDSNKKFSFNDSDVIDLSGKACVTLVNADYEVIYHSTDNKEHRLIRSRQREIIAIDEVLTKDIKVGKYFVGLNPKDCKPLVGIKNDPINRI